jgi:hypothetical protein
MNELAKVMARVSGKVSAYVLFVKPKEAPADWDDTELHQSATAIPGVTVLVDDGGAEAQRFGAETSGQTFLYDRSGALLFSGGITEARGHAGDNDGESALVRLANDQSGRFARTSVFGCSFVDRSAPKGPLCFK